MPRALLIVDIQNDYFPGGAHPLVEPEAAAGNAATVLGAVRSSGGTVVHIQHVWDSPDATFMRPSTPGIEIHASVRPLADETLISKTEPNAFLGTSLETTLRTAGIDELIVTGMMTSMCVDATVRAAADLGFTVTVVHDACAAPDLEFGATTVPGAVVHAAFMAALDGSYATTVSAAEFASTIR